MSELNDGNVQTALVTGASRGIGRAIAAELASRGYRVIGTATSDAGAQAITDALVRQAAGPVRWVEVVQSLKALGVTHVYECGPGKVLAGMARRIDGELVTGSLYDPATLAEVKGALA